MERFLFLACNQLGAAGSTRRKPRGLRWETHSEGLGESNTNQNKKAQQQQQQQKTPNFPPLPFPAAAKRSVNRGAAPPGFPSAGMSCAVSLRSLVLFTGKMCPLCSEMEKGKRKRKKKKIGITSLFLFCERGFRRQECGRCRK